MADKIICPICGAENPANQKICHNCQTPLGDEAFFQTGQAPTEKDTGELEPLLPQWLRDMRQPSEEASAAAPRQEEAIEPPQTPSPKQENPAAEPVSSLDFLANLGAQADDNEEEEIPDWLASITGATSPKKENADMPSGIRWTENARSEDAPQSDDWLADLRQPVAQESDEANDWFSQTSQETAEAPFESSAPTIDDTPDWLKQMSAEASEPSEPQEAQGAPTETSNADDWFNQPTATDAGDTPDWLKQMSAEAGEPQKPQEAPTETSNADDWFNQPTATDAGDTPDWLKQMSAEAGEPQKPQEAPTETSNADDWFNQPTATDAGDTPDWLKQMSAEASEPQEAPPSAPTTDDTPDWLKADFATQAEAPSADDVELPSWMSSTQSESESAEPTATASATDVAPDWLNELGSVGGDKAPFVEEYDSAESAPSEDFASSWLQSSETPSWLTSDDKTAAPPFQGASDDLFGDMPDWLKSAAPDATIFDAPADFGIPKTEETPREISASFTASAFSEDIFSSADNAVPADIPDWLSSAMSEAPSGGNIPEAIEGDDARAPDVLPSWVEAMRPSDQSGMAGIVSAANAAAVESKGALTGISGALPFVAGFTPTSKPKAYGLKLNASEEQLKHAAILEQILAAETTPPALAAKPTQTSARGLRWAIAFLLLIATLFSAFTNSKIFSLPLLAPRETLDVIDLARNLPENAPVLVVVDYDAARSAEMESAVAPLLDGMLLLKHPRLTFVSNTEMGAALTEHLMRGALAFHAQNGATYLNLGYLPGGSIGIRAFADDPTRAASLDAYGNLAWDAPALQGVAALDQFALILLVVDNADSVRAWVEQTQSIRGATPLLAISSAQAAPLIQPYYAAGQIRGIVGGIFGGALLERHFSGGRPGMARTYWDAYSIGMALAAAFLILGGLINLAANLRERSMMKEGK